MYRCTEIGYLCGTNSARPRKFKEDNSRLASYGDGATPKKSLGMKLACCSFIGGYPPFSESLIFEHHISSSTPSLAFCLMISGLIFRKSSNNSGGKFVKMSKKKRTF